MNTHADKTQKNKSQSAAHEVSKKQSIGGSTFQFVDNRPEIVAQRKLQEMTNISPQAKQAAQLQVMADNYSVQQQQPIQNKENNTGLPDNLKSGIENISGYSMDDVKVHYNSDKPAQLNAHAYAQGTDIHLGSGQEKHLPHEAWHVVQQKQGRVKPTVQLKGKVNINDDEKLEKEAVVMGARANNTNHGTLLQSKRSRIAFAESVGQPVKGFDIIQRSTMVEYQIDPLLVNQDVVLDDMVHERVMHTNADRFAAAIASGYGGIPPGMICNHHESYAHVRGRVYNQIIGLDVENAAGWINHMGGNLQPNGMGNYRRFDVNNEVSNLIEVLANHVNNLFYWPVSTGGNPDTPTGPAPGGVTLVNQVNRLQNYRNNLP